MSDKIKISIPEKIYELLKKDAKDFRILKPSGEENLNSFINSLVVNFHEEFSLNEQSLWNSIKEALSFIPEKYKNEALEGVVGAIAKRDKNKNAGKSVSLSFKPTKNSEAVTVYIENVLLKNESISSFYRRMFTAYSKKAKDERERIIHKRTFELLSCAMEKKLQVCISLDNGHIYNGVSVYAVEPAQDELFNYVLAYSDKRNRTLRIAKIRTVSLLTKGAEIPESSARMFDRQISSGAQYPIYSTDDEPIRVRLSDKGRELFNKIYLYRPVPVSIDDDVYTFECSANQVLYYFERFGAEALILHPKKLGIFMRNYYYFALKKYRSIYGKD